MTVAASKQRASKQPNSNALTTTHNSPSTIHTASIMAVILEQALSNLDNIKDKFHKTCIKEFFHESFFSPQNLYEKVSFLRLVFWHFYLSR